MWSMRKDLSFSIRFGNPQGRDHSLAMPPQTVLCYNCTRLKALYLPCKHLERVLNSQGTCYQLELTIKNSTLCLEPELPVPDLWVGNCY